jgi:alanine-synthesizing transaminase
MLMGSLVDEILVPSPTYPPYMSYLKFFGGIPPYYKTEEEYGWKPDIQDIKSKVTNLTKGDCSYKSKQSYWMCV